MPVSGPKRRKGVSGYASDLRGVSRLAVDALAGVTDIVEDLHRIIAARVPVAGQLSGGITGLVYSSVRGITRAVGLAIDAALAPLERLLGGSASSPGREAVLAALNGVLGDHLAESGNPLAIPMRLRTNGQALDLERGALAAAFPHAGGRLLVLVHGLCMSDVQWNRDGHDHGAALARDLGYTPLYLHYNSGRHVSTNGREFAGLMDRLLQAWPVRVDELVIVGHSMGGLVARSACHCAKRARQAWLRRLKALIFLGTPHHGAPLERAGHWTDVLLEISPFTAPFARLGKIRSAGVRDLRYGSLLDQDWAGRGKHGDRRAFVPLPGRVPCFAIAATRQAQPGVPGRRLPGDGLVPVRSALGQHDDADLSLPIPATRLWVCYGAGHIDLLASGEACERMHLWLAPGA